jgi:hypothetical protein
MHVCVDSVEALLWLLLRWLSWFMTRFESRGAHGSGEQWNARDTRVYTGSRLPDVKNPTSCVCRLYYDYLGRYPLYPAFYRLRG